MTDWSIGLDAVEVVVLALELAALATIPSVLLRRQGRPVSSLAWVLGLIALPGLGVAAWWTIGRSQMKRRRRRRARANRRIGPALEEVRRGTVGGSPPVAPAAVPITRLPGDEAAGLFPMVASNRVTLLTDATEAYPAIGALIDSARRHLHVLMYEIEPDEIGRAFVERMAARARAGVEVRVLVDPFGSPRVGRRFMAPLIEAGGRFAVFSARRWLRRAVTMNFRNHRKIVVADGASAYTGGLNLGASYTRAWHDLGVILSGPVVGQLQEVFAEDWYFAARESLAEHTYFTGGESSGEPPPGAAEAACGIVASGPDSVENLIHDVLFVAINEAHERIFIMTPYLAPSGAVLTALRTATYRGVDVRLLVPRRSDVTLATWAGRSYYPQLLAAGVRIFEFLPAVLHAKAWVFDRDLAVIGSANLDSRSFRLNFESSCFIRGPEINAQLAATFAADLGMSEEVDAARVAGRPRRVQLAEAVANLLAPLL